MFGFPLSASSCFLAILKKNISLCVRCGTLQVNLGSKNTLYVKCNDILRVETPGGGGYGNPSDCIPSDTEGLC